MPISFTCPHCGHQTDVADEYAGQSGPCANCGQTVTMPLPGQIGYGSESPAALPRASRSSGWAAGLLGAAAVGVFLCCGGGLLLSLFLPAIQGARESARRAQCAGNLQRLGLAMQSYHNAYGCFPPAYLADEKGRPTHSWRALLLPYIDPVLAAQYRWDEAWDGPNNQLLHARTPDVYRCPSDASPTAAGQTDYVVIQGLGAVFDGTKCSRLWEITDGAAETLLIVEVVETDIAWLEPRDLRLDQISGAINAPKGDEISSQHPTGATVLTADGKVNFLSEDLAGQDVRAMVTKAGGEAVALP